MKEIAAKPQPLTLPWGLLLALLAGLAIILLPEQAGLPIAGQRMLAILAFAVIVWISEAVSYEVSAIMILALMAFLLGSAPSLAAPDKLIGTKDALSIALGGFANSALALVAGGAGKTAVLVYTMPFWVIPMAWWVLGERVRGLQWAAIAIAGSGLVLILQPWSMGGSAFSNLLAVAGGALDLSFANPKLVAGVAAGAVMLGTRSMLARVSKGNSAVCRACSSRKVSRVGGGADE